MVDAIDSSKKNRTTVILNSSRDVAYLKFMMYNHLQNNYFFRRKNILSRRERSPFPKVVRRHILGVVDKLTVSEV